MNARCGCFALANPLRNTPHPVYDNGFKQSKEKRMAMNEARPDPDRLLARLQSEEQQVQRGKLKIFLGYAAGVGKTFAMLEAAHQRKAEGVDVVVGYIETHGRDETEALVTGLEVLPRETITYRGVALDRAGY